MQDSDDLAFVKEAISGPSRGALPKVPETLVPDLADADRFGDDEAGRRSCLEHAEALLKSWRHSGPLVVGAPWLRQPLVYPLF
jgi:hypothetical protein